MWDGGGARRRAVGLASAMFLCVMNWKSVASATSEVPVGIVVKGSVIRANSTQLRGDRVLAAVEQHGQAVAPMLEVLNIFDARAVVDKQTGAIRISGDGHELSLRIGDRNATFDARSVQLSIPPEDAGGTIIVPVRAVAEAFGADVSWVPNERLAILETDPAPRNRNTPNPESSVTTRPIVPGAMCRCCNAKRVEPQLHAPWQLPAAFVVAEALLFGGLLRWRWRGLTWVTVAQLFIGLVGIVGATLRAFPVDRTADTPYPLADDATAGWMALVVIAFFLPRISKLKWFNAELELKDQVKETTENFERSTTNLSALLQNWTQALAIFAAMYSSGNDRTMLLMNFTRDRLGETKLWIRPDGVEDDEDTKVKPEVKSDVRLALWIFDASAGVLRFFYSNEITDPETLGSTFAPGQGLVGQAFLEGRFWNEPDAEAVPGFVKIAGQRRIGGTICAPVWLQERARPLGMLTVDKEAVGEFLLIEENIVKALAALIAMSWRVAGLDTARPEESR